MPAGVEIFNSVLNQLGSPAIYSDVFANRPAFGFTGRLFISTDTNEIYRDTGAAWVLISSGGGGVNIYNSDGTLTAARTMTMAGFPLTFSGGASAVYLNLNASAGVDRDIIFQTAGVNRWEFLVTGAETGSNAGADIALRSYNDVGTLIFSPFRVRRRTGEIETFAEENITTGGQSIIGLYTNSTGTYANGLTTTGGNPQSSNFNIYTLASAGDVTFANSNLVGTTVNVLRAQVQNAGTVTFPASATSALRAATNFVSQLQYNTFAAAGTYTHMANIHLQGIYEVSGGNVFTITNAYQLLLNSLNENGYTGAQLALTNRWGIYQNGAADNNYFAGRVNINTTTVTNYQLNVNSTGGGDGIRVGVGATNRILLDSGGSISWGLSANAGTLTYSGTDAVIQTASALRLNTGGFNRILLTSAGDLGIGTTTPNASITIDRAGSAEITLRGNNNNSFTEFILGQGIGNASYLFNRAAAALLFGTSNFERMRITLGGNLLVGTTSDAGYLFHLAGNQYISNNGNLLLGQATIGGSTTKTLIVGTGTAPTTSQTDSFQIYSADQAAGNACLHTRTENGAILKIYQETTAVGSATFASPGAGSTVKTDDTFDGYTLQQVVKALRNQGLLA